MQVAQTILSQLGGGRFVMMTGAKNLVGSPDSLKMQVMGGKHVKVTLDPSDTYTVEVFKLRGASMVGHKSVSDVYCDELRSVFESLTGLYTSL